MRGYDPQHQCAQKMPWFAGPRNLICGKCGGVYVKWCGCELRLCTCVTLKVKIHEGDKPAK